MRPWHQLCYLSQAAARLFVAVVICANVLATAPLEQPQLFRTATSTTAADILCRNAGGGPSGLLTALALLEQGDKGGFPWHIDLLEATPRPDEPSSDETDPGPPVLLTARGQVALASLGLIPAIDEVRQGKSNSGSACPVLYQITCDRTEAMHDQASCNIITRILRSWGEV